jgi:colicin import membrane protein
MSRSAARITPPPGPDPFRYGWRYVERPGPDGSVEVEEVPLTRDDVLHPQEGDVIPEGTLQEQDAEYLRPIFRQRTARLPGGFFLADCLVDWGRPGIRPHSPDLVVFRDVRNPPQGDIGLFRLRDAGGRCVLVVEIVSPHTRRNDAVRKVRHYHRVGVPLYVLLDQRREGGPRTVVGYRHTAQRYVNMRLDRRGRLRLKPLGLWLAIEDQRAVCYDADTGERIPGYEEMAAGRQAAEQRIRELEAELRRVRGE